MKRNPPTIRTRTRLYRRKILIWISNSPCPHNEAFYIHSQPCIYVDFLCTDVHSRSRKIPVTPICEQIAPLGSFYYGRNIPWACSLQEIVAGWIVVLGRSLWWCAHNDETLFSSISDMHARIFALSQILWDDFTTKNVRLRTFCTFLFVCIIL